MIKVSKSLLLALTWAVASSDAVALFYWSLQLHLNLTPIWSVVIVSCWIVATLLLGSVLLYPRKTAVFLLAAALICAILLKAVFTAHGKDLENPLTVASLAEGLSVASPQVLVTAGFTLALWFIFRRLWQSLKRGPVTSATP